MRHTPRAAKKMATATMRYTMIVCMDKVCTIVYQWSDVAAWRADATLISFVRFTLIPTEYRLGIQ